MAAAAAIIGGVTSVGFGIVGAISARKAKRKAKWKARKIQFANIDQLENEAADTVRVRDDLLRDHYWNASLFKGDNLANAYASGVDPHSGSALAIREQSAALLARDAVVIRREAGNKLADLKFQMDLVNLGAQVDIANIGSQFDALALQGIGQAIQGGARAGAEIARTFGSTPPAQLPSGVSI